MYILMTGKGYFVLAGLLSFVLQKALSFIFVDEKAQEWNN